MYALKDVLARAENWPTSAQEDLVNAALIIEQNQASDDEFTAEDWKIIDERLAASARGEFATDAEMEALYAKYRLA
jgi:predicted transcriptional regulator